MASPRSATASTQRKRFPASRAPTPNPWLTRPVPPSAVGGRPMLDPIVQAVSDRDFPRFKALLTMLGTAGSLKEAVESLTVEDARLQGLNLLHFVVIIGGRMRFCRYLVEGLGVDVDCVSLNSSTLGSTPLFFSILSGDVGTAKYLLDHGANPNKANLDGVCPLHQAARLGHCDMVELLLAKGAYVDPVAANMTPLYIAAKEGHACCMKILLDHNADYNRMVNGKTPLMAAMEGTSKKCIHLLIKAGADIRGGAIYAVENPNATKLLSPDICCHEYCLYDDEDDEELPPPEEEDDVVLSPQPNGEVVVSLGRGRGTGGCSMEDLGKHVLPAFKRTDDAEKELKKATIAFDAGAPGAADHLQAAKDEQELAGALCRMVERDYLGIK